MSKILLAVILILAVIILALSGLLFWQQDKTQTTPAVADYKNITYSIENQQIKLVDGYFEAPVATGSASKVVTQYFGNEAKGDLNGDGKEDVAFLLTQQTSGSGTFYYVAVALKTDAGWQSAGTMFLGDRIAPQSTQINKGIITVNYADRKPNEPMTATPSVGVSKFFDIKDGVLQIITMFESPFTLTIGQDMKFSDGLIVGLTQINDSRCKQGVVCIWAGELSPVLTVVGGNFGGVPEEIKLGTSTAKTVTNNNYTFELKDANETSVTLVITKKIPVLDECFVGGCSMQICSDRTDVVTDCMYKPEYGCYKTATCAKQSDGKCGWTQTPALQACVKTGKIH